MNVTARAETHVNQPTDNVCTREWVLTFNQVTAARTRFIQSDSCSKDDFELVFARKRGAHFNEATVRSGVE